MTEDGSSKPRSRKLMATLFAILAAGLFGLSAPVSKVLLKELSPTVVAALLYLGAGAGMAIVGLLQRTGGKAAKEARITRHELPYVLAMIGLDIAAPILLMLGLTRTTSANASLLNNFEIVATSVIALLFFKEAIGKRLWTALGLITLASIILSVEDMSSFSFSLGSLFVLLAATCWGLENNCTRMLAVKDPLQVVVIKGFGAGFGSLALAWLLKEQVADVGYVAAALVLGFFAYGLSIFFYVSAQRELGAARTSAYYAVAPFIGVGLSFAVFREPPTAGFGIALLIMVAGAYFTFSEDHDHAHEHEKITHEHRHSHNDGHHDHEHAQAVNGEHNHPHTHEPTRHAHSHTPDLHHAHAHSA